MFEGTSCINDPIIISPDLAFRAEATTGEGSIWHPDRNTLFWVDIEGKTLYEYIPDLQNCRSWQFDRMVSTVVPETDSTVVVALQNEIIRVNLTDGNTASIAPIPDNNGKIRCNDGKCDPSGRLWIGTMGFGAPKGAASLYCVWADGTVETKLTKVTCVYPPCISMVLFYYFFTKKSCVFRLFFPFFPQCCTFSCLISKSCHVSLYKYCRNLAIFAH